VGIGLTGGVGVALSAPFVGGALGYDDIGVLGAIGGFVLGVPTGAVGAVAAAATGVGMGVFQIGSGVGTGISDLFKSRKYKDPAPEPSPSVLRSYSMQNIRIPYCDPVIFSGCTDHPPPVGYRHTRFHSRYDAILKSVNPSFGKIIVTAIKERMAACPSHTKELADRKDHLPWLFDENGRQAPLPFYAYISADGLTAYIDIGVNETDTTRITGYPLDNFQKALIIDICHAARTYIVMSKGVFSDEKIVKEGIRTVVWNNFLPNPIHGFYLYPQILRPVYGADETIPYGSTVVMVHGLGGAPEKTWMCGAKKNAFRFVSGQKLAWHDIIDVLANDDTDSSRGPVRVLYLQHYFAIGSMQSSLTIKDFLNMVMPILMDAKVGSTPVLWIGHSLGGLLIQEILRRSELLYPDLLSNTLGTLFLGSPHKGAWKAKVCGLFSFLRSDAIRYLSPDSEATPWHAKRIQWFLGKQVPFLNLQETTSINWVVRVVSDNEGRLIDNDEVRNKRIDGMNHIEIKEIVVSQCGNSIGLREVIRSQISEHAVLKPFSEFYYSSSRRAKKNMHSNIGASKVLLAPAINALHANVGTSQSSKIGIVDSLIQFEMGEDVESNQGTRGWLKATVCGIDAPSGRFIVQFADGEICTMSCDKMRKRQQEVENYVPLSGDTPKPHTSEVWFCDGKGQIL
jgi:hypothetical protein